jgi:probable O-glycosylation ligase (exosortase A-associated)
MILTTNLALYPEDAWIYEKNTFKSQLMNFITIIFVNSYERVKALLWVLVLSIGFYMVKGGIFTALTAGNYMVVGPEGSYLGNNTIGLTAAMLVPLIRFLQIESTKPRVKQGLSFLIVCCVLVSAASYSRGAMLAIGAMGGFLWLKSAKKLPVLLLVTILGLLTYNFMPERWMSRMETVETYDEDASAMGRINAWEMSWNFTKDHPIFGGGFGVGGRAALFMVYAPVPADVHDFHSNYFSVLAHQGFVGLFMYLLIMFLAWRTGSRVIKQCKTIPELAWAGNLAAMLQVSLIGYWVGGAFLNLAYWDLPYLLIALLVILDQLVKENLKAKGISSTDGFYRVEAFPDSQRKRDITAR